MGYVIRPSSLANFEQIVECSHIRHKVGKLL